MSLSEARESTSRYFIGGTLLAMTLAYMAEVGDKRITSASFLTTQTDFSQGGDLRILRRGPSARPRRASAVVNCQSALAWLVFRSSSQAAISCREPRLGFIGDVGGMVVEDQLYRGQSRI